MNTTSTSSNTVFDVISWLFGLLALAIGVVNTFWGNDPGFGMFIILVATVFFPPISALTKKVTGFAIPGLVKVLLALFILWSSLGVGELFDKIDLMMASFN
ncbi:hypothetical protein [Hymenobacter koreensis]|uniref:Uncharacterized protein n=1 Tax=Hymenobacter koreensis TaxID=1084523 RepID=A0ABP8J389_9BACT